MINRDNYLLVREFIEYRDKVWQNEKETVRTYWQSMKHFLQWLDSRPVEGAEKVVPTFPEYILTARNAQHPNTPAPDRQLSVKRMTKTMAHARAFFDWLRTVKHVKISEGYTQTLQIRKSAKAQSKLTKREYWHLEDAEKIAALKPESIREKRDIAALCFLFLSGARIGAFVTLPHAAVDIAKSKVIQSPEIGVRTKNSKAAITFLLPIDSLMKPIKEWHDFIAGLEGDYLWYPALNYSGEKPLPGGITNTHTGRVEAFKQGLKVLCKRAGVEYLSPHKIRHGHGVYGVKNAKDVSELKAISQNLMHANIGITDGIYGRLAEDDLSEIIAKFGRRK